MDAVSSDLRRACTWPPYLPVIGVHEKKTAEEKTKELFLTSDSKKTLGLSVCACERILQTRCVGASNKPPNFMLPCYITRGDDL